MKKIILIIFFVILSYNVLGAECSVPIIENCTVSSSMTLSNAFQYINDTGTKNGVIRINANNVVLTLRNITLIGDTTASTRAIDFNFNNNVTIDGGTFVGYAWGIYSSGGDNIVIKNGIYNNTANYGLQVRNTNNSYIKNNTFNNQVQVGIIIDNDVSTYANNGFVHVIDNTINTALRDGILIQIGYKHNISNNKLYNAGYGAYHGIKLVSSNYTTISNNLINNSNESGIFTGTFTSNYNNVFNNNISYSRDCLKTSDANSNYYNNIISNCRHDAIDMYAAEGTLNARNNNIYNNTINGSLIYLSSGRNVSIYNNTLIDVNTNDVGTDGAIIIEGNQSDAYENNVYNNNITLSNASKFIIISTVNGSTYNNLLNGYGSIEFSNYYNYCTQQNKNFIYNNTFSIIGNYTTTLNCNGYSSNTSVEDNNSYTKLYMQNRRLLFNYIGTKSFYKNNYTISIYNQLINYPNNDLKNMTNNQLIASNFDNYSITVINDIEVGNFDSVKYCADTSYTCNATSCNYGTNYCNLWSG